MDRAARRSKAVDPGLEYPVWDGVDPVLRRLARVQAGGGGRKVRRKWPRRKDHKAPKPPKLRVLPKRLQARINKEFLAK